MVDVDEDCAFERPVERGTIMSIDSLQSTIMAKVAEANLEEEQRTAMSTLLTQFDYRSLNQVSQRDSYPLPRIDESLDSLARGKFITTLDAWILARGSCRGLQPKNSLNFSLWPFPVPGAPLWTLQCTRHISETNEQCACWPHLQDLCSVFR